MKTKTITSLDELVPGMKTKDGKVEFRYFRESDAGGHYAIYQHIDGMVIPYFPDEEHASQIFLNQEVEVPE